MTDEAIAAVAADLHGASNAELPAMGTFWRPSGSFIAIHEKSFSFPTAALCSLYRELCRPRSAGFVASDVALLCQEAALRALRRGIQAGVSVGLGQPAADLERQLGSLSLGAGGGADAEAAPSSVLCVTEADVRDALRGIHPSAMREARKRPPVLMTPPPRPSTLARTWPGHITAAQVPLPVLPLRYVPLPLVTKSLPPSLRLWCRPLQVAVEMPTTSWDDIGGLEDVKRELREVVDWCALTLSPTYQPSRLHCRLCFAHPLRLILLQLVQFGHC